MCQFNVLIKTLILSDNIPSPVNHHYFLNQTHVLIQQRELCINFFVRLTYQFLF
jgi:hypothetical protein